MSSSSSKETHAVIKLHGDCEARAVLKTDTGIRTLPRMPLNELMSKIRSDIATLRDIKLQIIGAGPGGEDLYITEMRSLDSIHETCS